KLRHIIGKATRPEPADRYATVAELVTVIETYQRSEDPEVEVAGAFATLIQQMKPLAERRRYLPEQIQSMLHMLDRIFTEDLFAGMKAFDEIPEGLLTPVAEKFTDDFLPVLRRYVLAVNEHSGNYQGFEYAEVVARKMHIVFNAPTALEVKS